MSAEFAGGSDGSPAEAVVEKTPTDPTSVRTLATATSRPLINREFNFIAFHLRFVVVSTYDFE